MQTAVMKLVGVGVIIALIFFKFMSMSNEIITTRLRLTSATKSLNIAELKLTTLEENNANLVNTLETMSAKYDVYKTTAAEAKRKLANWRKQSDKEKYKTVTNITNSDVINYEQATCTEALDLNKAIAIINFKDL